ncbi:GLPGLI family protein [Aquimarina sp. BL5]|uniref:GLPGLI family protein n=1 Tax=Aquimarina sp. BL5 TaxID=1714860 RepID=UPI000E4FD84A|nr:GLPGLI family protein [Aquimarina sp. BL5]AXT51240.1 GLPGLI family protein [Aquimarina sp. BL5]RKN09451.1 GLPGLI family protein [Aquimarina sp. BL5]
MIRLIVLIALSTLGNISAQDFQGVATYQTNRKLDIKLDSTQLNSEMQKQIHEMMKKQFQKEFTLHFNKTESVYKEEESLETPQPSTGIRVMVAGSGASDILYKNNKEERFVAQREMLGKMFLVKDTLTHYNWKLENETKKIGNYTCYKATAKRTIQRITSMSTNNVAEENVETEEEITVTAWYTPEIPVNNGPANFWGLPGLIMAINDGQQSMLCDKIVLSPKRKVEILESNKGKVVNENKFEEIMRKKMQEIQDRRPNRDDGNSMQIRIGG